MGYWQTLIAGLLAVGAAAITIWATIRSATREIAASNAMAAIAQKQVDTMLRLDRLRTLYESHAFLQCLEAAAAIVVGNVQAARTTVPVSTSVTADSAQIYFARQSVLCPLFPDLRPACVRLGGDLAHLFAQLDQDLVAFASQWSRLQSIGGLGFEGGKYNGFHSGLDSMEEQAKVLRKRALESLNRTAQELVHLEASGPST